MRKQKCFLSVAVTALLLASIATGVPAQTYPARPVRLLLGFPAGGPTDVIARVLAQRLSGYWGQPVVVENRPGADASIAMEIVAKAVPDGHTLYVIQPGVAINPALYKSVPFDPIKDFAPITLIGDVPNLVAIHPAVAASTLPEFIALAREKKGQFFYGATSSPTMLATELFNTMAGISLVRVNFKGAPPAIVALVAGEVQVLVSGIGTLLPLAKAGKVRALAITSARRSALAPEIATADENGVRGYIASTWYGISAPGATPRRIVDQVNNDVRKALGEPEVKARLLEQGIEPTPNTPEQFAAMIRAELAKWAKVVKDSGVSIE